VYGRFVQIVQEGSEASLRDHISLKVLGENRRRKLPQPPTLSNALNVLSLNGSGKQALNASRALAKVDILSIADRIGSETTHLGLSLNLR